MTKIYGNSVDRLIQEDVDGGWQMLVACILLNRTKADQVRTVLSEFFEKWPTARCLLRADVEEIKDVVKVLGLRDVRTIRLVQMSADYLAHRPIQQIRGVGQYAYESWRIFMEMDLDFVPKDRVLRNYVERARKKKV